MVRTRQIKPVHTLSLAEVERALGFKQPGLILLEDEDVIVAKGTYSVHDGPHGDGPLARFQVFIIFSKSYPEEEPVVMETAGDIERFADRHMYANGACCTCVWEEWLAMASDTSLKGFCEGPLHNFFLGQVIFDRTGEWPFGERAHGSDGIIEAAGALLTCEVNKETAPRYLHAVSAEMIKGHWPCPCGSTKILRDCCLKEVEALRSTIDQRLAKRLLTRLRRQLKREREVKAKEMNQAARYSQPVKN